MNAVELVAEVQKIVDAGTGSFSDEQVLAYLNRGMLAVANRLLLPWLSTSATVTTDTTNTVSLPAYFHRNLFMATTDDGQLDIISSPKSLEDEYPSDSTDTTLKAVCVIPGNLQYSYTPDDATDITLHYYRRPLDMTLEDTSEPMTSNDDFYMVIINYAAWQMFSILEQGVEGAKVSTMYHKNEYKEYLEDIKQICIKEGRSFRAPQYNKTW